jgi:hypothetical protein
VPHPVITIGPFTVGEIPAQLQYQFQDADGNPIDLTGYTAVFQWGARDNTTMFSDAQSVAANIVDESNGRVRHVWSGDELSTPGRYAGMFWVGNGVNRFASILILWTTCLSVDNPPDI